jgi:hypothetical protein
MLLAHAEQPCHGMLVLPKEKTLERDTAPEPLTFPGSESQ